VNVTAVRAASPCVGLCRLDETTGWCLGCGRTGAEIGAWRAAGEDERGAILATLSERLGALDRPLRRLGGTEAFRAAVAPVLEGRGGAVAAGPHGAVTAFAAAPGEAVEAAWHDGALVASTCGGRLVTARGAIAAFAAGEAGPVVLAVLDDGRRLPVARGLTRLGEDAAAPAGRPGVLFDLGLGFDSARVMVRSHDAALTAALAALEGVPLARLLSEAGAVLLEASPTRIVETLAVRIEADGPIPLPGDRSPAAAGSRLMPGAVAIGRLMPPGIAEPEGFLAVAVVYPPVH